MTITRIYAWSWMDDVLPFVAMLTVTCVDMAVLTVVKAAMNDGLGSIVYVIYHNALGTLILLPIFVVHIIRKVDRPPLTFRILFRFFILGLLGICLFQVLWYVGVNYSSPTMASAMSNLSPGITFLIAVVFRTEKIDIQSSSSLAKLFGTAMAMLGAMVFTLYQGPVILRTIGTLNSPNQLLILSQSSYWIFGSLVTLTSLIFCCLWIVLQTTTAREYPDQQTLVFFCCLFGTLQCIALSPFLVRNRSAWVLQHGFWVTAVVLGAVYSTAIRNNVLTWCMRKKGPVFVAMFSPLSIVLAVIMGVTFLGDSLRLGSAIGAMIVAGGFYTVIWGQTKEKIKMPVVMGDNLDVSDEPAGSSSDQTAPLLASRNGPEC